VIPVRANCRIKNVVAVAVINSDLVDTI